MEGNIIIIIVMVLFSWLIIYKLYSEKLDVASSRIRSKGLRVTVRALLKITYALSLVLTIFWFISQIASLFNKNKN